MALLDIRTCELCKNSYKTRRRDSAALCLVTILATFVCLSGADGVVFDRASMVDGVRLRGHGYLGKGVVKLGVLAPADPHHEQSLPRILPAVSLAVKAVISAKGPLPGWNVTVNHRDSQCSSTYGALAAFDFYINNTAGQSILCFQSSS